MISRYDGFIIDFDGTLVLEENMIAGAADTLNKLQSAGKKIVIITNKTIEPAEKYQMILKNNGFSISVSNIIDASKTTKKIMQAGFSGKKFFAIGERNFIENIISVGLEYSEAPELIDVVIVTLDRNISERKIEIAEAALNNGAEFFAANIDATCPVAGGEIKDAGITISELEERTGRKLKDNFGKPSIYMMNEALNAIELPKEKCLLIGDRIETDILMGQTFGLDTALVNSGVEKDFVMLAEIKPTFQLDSIADLK